MTNHTRAEAVSLLTSRSTGVLATLSPEGQPRARTLYYVANESFEVFFMTLADTRKVVDLNHVPRAAFVVSDDQAPHTIQIEGTIEAQPDTAVIDPIVSKLMENFMRRGPDFAPLTHLDPTTILFYKLTPTWVRFGDFTETSGTDEALVSVNL